MSDTVKYIFGKSDYVKGIGEIFPIRMKHYDEFMNIANIICLSDAHFNMEEIKKIYASEDAKLFDAILLLVMGINDEKSFNNLIHIISSCLRKKVTFDEDSRSFKTDEGMALNRNNYDSFREIVMRQNLLFTPKVYKNKKTQEWAEKVMKTRAKNGLDSSIESMISTISVFSGKDYERLEEYTIYQVRQEFHRILKMEAYRTGILFRSVGSKDIPEHFAENLDMFKNPYDDLFKDKSKLKNINSAIKG